MNRHKNTILPFFIKLPSVNLEVAADYFDVLIMNYDLILMNFKQKLALKCSQNIIFEIQDGRHSPYLNWDLTF